MISSPTEYSLIIKVFHNKTYLLSKVVFDKPNFLYLNIYLLNAEINQWDFIRQICVTHKTPKRKLYYDREIVRIVGWMIFFEKLPQKNIITAAQIDNFSKFILSLLKEGKIDNPRFLDYHKSKNEKII